ncbi:hypothetical protein HMPREF1982_04531 [Clostridiales bacterium oral taxon 876 str. F0540]|nr:hypothetical protein HMPREF1982_04531 [Clostridiales bacterium oral taxon 876 str. F0540]
MGTNKLMLKLGEKTIINRVIESAKASKLEELVLVYGKYNMDTDIVKVYNPDYELGMSTSIKKGLEGFEGDGVMILLGDMPFITSEIINKLYDGFCKSNKNIAAPIYKRRRGNPVIIGKKYFNELLKNTGDKGAREIINNNACDVELIEIQSDGIFVDVDDKESYNSLRA